MLMEWEWNVINNVNGSESHCRPISILTEVFVFVFFLTMDDQYGLKNVPG